MRRWARRGLIIGGPVAISVLAITYAANHPVPAYAPATAAVTATPTPAYSPIGWTLAGVMCADGSGSSSIGERGACSWHGGEVTVYYGSDGSTLRCVKHLHPPWTGDEQQEEMARFHSLFCT